MYYTHLFSCFIRVAFVYYSSIICVVFVHYALVFTCSLHVLYSCVVMYCS